MKKILLIIVLTTFFCEIKSQSLFQKKADHLYSELSYLAAVDFYKSLVKSDTPTESNMRKLADCYFKIYDFQNAEVSYKNLITKFSSNTTELDLISYLQCLKYNQKYNIANDVIKQLEQKRNDNLISKNHSNKKNYENELKKDSAGFKIYNIEKLNTENSEFAPVIFNNKTNILFASNRRNTSAKNKTFAWDDSYFIDMYTANKTDSITFNSIIAMNKGVTSTFHDGPLTLSGDEKTVYLTKSSVVTKKVKGENVNVVNLKLYIIKKDDKGNLSKPESFKYNSDEYSLGHAAITKDGKRIYFISDMPGGFGQTDIWFCENENGTWAKPENLGQAINTEGREMFPYVYDDGTLFFSTDGRAGLGGLDIYFAVPSIDAYFEPQSLGYPINTNTDDFGFALNDDLKSGYFSSNRSGGKGKDDIYFFNSKNSILFVSITGIVFDESTKDIIPNTMLYLLDNNKLVIDSVKADSKARYTFKINDASKTYFLGAKERNKFYDRLIPVGKLQSGDNKKDIGLYPKYKLMCNVIDGKTKVPINGVKTTFTDKSNNNKLIFTTNSEGNFIEIIKNKKPGDKLDYSIKFEKEGYITVEKYYTQILDINTIIDLKEQLQKMELGTDLAKVIQINPIYFDLSKFNIRSDAAIELDKIVKVMSENPSMTIELGSHTDCRSSAAFNISLSTKRAKSSADYIISKGITKNRIVSKGYGESKLINSCACEGKTISTCSEDEHQANRRTEFLITKY